MFISIYKSSYYKLISYTVANYHFPDNSQLYKFNALRKDNVCYAYSSEIIGHTDINRPFKIRVFLSFSFFLYLFYTDYLNMSSPSNPCVKKHICMKYGSHLCFSQQGYELDMTETFDLHHMIFDFLKLIVKRSCNIYHICSNVHKQPPVIFDPKLIISL